MPPTSFSENGIDRHRLSGRLMEDDFLVATSLRNPWVTLTFGKHGLPVSKRHFFATGPIKQALLVWYYGIVEKV
jgi:hypothetical protein